MDEPVRVVVDGFRSLTSRQQTKAWIEIEAIWKESPDIEVDDLDASEDGD
jgi:hypothetical protein